MFLTFFESLNVVPIKIVIILMMTAKLATLGLLKRKEFWNKGYDVINYVRDLINKFLSRDTDYMVDLVM